MRIVFLMMMFISTLFAHKLNLFLLQENNKVFVSSYFASGAFCKNCKIEVLDVNQKLLQKGKTDEKGEFIITKLSSTLTVKVDASSGHIIKKNIKIENIKMEEIKEEENSNKEYTQLKEENIRLKSKIKLLEEKNSYGQILKMLFALLVIAGIFFALKRVKK